MYTAKTVLNLQENKVKHGLSLTVIRFIMRFKGSTIYNVVYRHPKISMAVIIMAGVIIIYTYINFLLTYVIV